MSLPVTVVTVAFGSTDVVKHWAEKWSDTTATCVISDNGNEKKWDVDKRVRILPYQGNKGFGAGINRAIEESDTPLVLITNPDTLPAQYDSLSRLISYHVRGSFTGAITSNSSEEEVHSTGIFPEKSWVRSQIFKPANNLWRKDRFDWIQGSLMMVHREDFLKIGGFSSKYPLYFEDVDICARAKKQGMNINFCETSRFIHDEGSGADRVTATRLSCFHWGMLEFFRSFDPQNAEAVKKMILAKCILRMFSYSVVNTQAAKGYYLALRSIIRGIAPGLPGSVHGK